MDGTVRQRCYPLEASSIKRTVLGSVSGTALSLNELDMVDMVLCLIGIVFASSAISVDVYSTEGTDRSGDCMELKWYSTRQFCS